MAVTALTAIKSMLVRIAKRIVLLCSLCSVAHAQLPSPYPTAPPLVPINPGLFGSPQGAGLLPGPGAGSGAFLPGRIQPFDPYSISGNTPILPPAPGTGLGGALPPTNFPGGLPGGFPGGLSGGPQFSPPPPGIWPGQTPSTLPGGTLRSLPPGAPITAAPPNIGAPYGTRVSPGGPGTRGGGLFGFGVNPSDPYFRGSPYGGNGNGIGNGGYGYGNNLRANNGQGRGYGPPYSRLFQDTGLRGTYLWGDEQDDLEITEAEASTSAYFPNFLGIPNGLRVTPGFVFHWLDGPHPPETAAAPGRLYSGYLDFGIRPRFTPRFGAEVNARVGVYSDFQAFNADTIRILGSGVGIYQVTPQFAFKLGGTYIDRVKIKFLPAAGVLWTPNPQTRWDIFFPSPKLANYWTTINNKQVWWYLGGEYGGGSWSFEREVAPSRGFDDRMDINDIRVFLGVELWNLNRYYGFAEVGYVFDRELVFFREPQTSIHVDETVMVRSGFSW